MNVIAQDVKHGEQKMQQTAQRTEEPEISLPHSVTFSNDGLLDIRGITIFGLSGKETTNPIGRFGTGLKYAIAILLRNDQALTIYIDNVKHTFFTKTEEFRGKMVELVYMCIHNQHGPGADIPLNFTTDYGKEWELWMAFRELYSNCVDENGAVEFVYGENDAEGANGKTVVVVYGKEFLEVAQQREDVFLQSQPVKNLGSLALHEGETKAVFNRGIKVAEFEKPLMHKYDITGHAFLTEDRTLRDTYYFNSDLSREVAKSDDRQLIEKIITAPKEYHESELTFNYDEPSVTFLETVKRLIKKGKDKVNPSAIRLYETVIKKIRAERKISGKRERYVVEVVRPHNVSATEMQRYIADAVSSWNGQFAVEDPLFHLDRDEIKVTCED